MPSGLDRHVLLYRAVDFYEFTDIFARTQSSIEITLRKEISKIKVEKHNDATIMMLAEEVELIRVGR